MITEDHLNLHLRQSHRLFYVGRETVSNAVTTILQRQTSTSPLQCFGMDCSKQFWRYDKLGDHLSNGHKMPKVNWSSCDTLPDECAGLPCNCALWNQLLSKPALGPLAGVSQTMSSRPENSFSNSHSPKSSSASPDTTLQEPEGEIFPGSPLFHKTETIPGDLQPRQNINPLQDHKAISAGSVEISQRPDNNQEQARSLNEESSASSPGPQANGEENVEEGPDYIPKAIGIKRSAFQASLHSSGETAKRKSKRPRKQATIGHSAPSVGRGSSAKASVGPMSSAKAPVGPMSESSAKASTDPRSSAKAISMPANNVEDRVPSVPVPKWKYNWEAADNILSSVGYFLIKEFEDYGCLVIACMSCRKAQAVDQQGYKTHAAAHKTPIPPDKLAIMETWIKQTSVKFKFANDPSELPDDWKKQHPKKALCYLPVADGFICAKCKKGYNSKDAGMRHIRNTHPDLHQKDYNSYEKLRPAVIQSIFDRKEYYAVTIGQEIPMGSHQHSISALFRPMYSSVREETGRKVGNQGPTTVKICSLLERTRWDKHLANLNLTQSQENNLLALAASDRLSGDGNTYGKPLLVIIRDYQLAVLGIANTTPPNVRIHLAKDLPISNRK